jgi:toxin ParE1/3/4
VKPVLLHREARAEIDAAMAYYERQQVGLGLALLAEVERALDSDTATSTAWRALQADSVPYYHLRRFPYGLFYMELEDFLWIAALAHDKRRPGYWKGRRVD